MTLELHLVRTYVPSLLTCITIMSLTAAIAFSSPESAMYPVSMIVTTVLASETSLASKPLLYWAVWVQYGYLWRDDSMLHSAVWGTLSGIIVIAVVASAHYREVTGAWYLFMLSVCIPVRGYMVQYMQAWDVMLHVMVYLFTFYCDYYCALYLQWEGRWQNDRLVRMRMMWPLFVTKWVLPLIGVQWMYYAYVLSETFSQRPEDTLVEEEVQQPTQRGWKKYRATHRKPSPPSLQSLIKASNGINSI